MKIRLEFDNGAQEPEIVIRCKELTDDVLRIQRILADNTKGDDVVFYKNNSRCYFPLNDVLFFESGEHEICAHTTNDVYTVKEKLYTLEDKLPRNFVRISKSAILNTLHVFSLEKHITSYSTVSFNKSQKQAFVSRNYLKDLLARLDETRRTF